MKKLFFILIGIISAGFAIYFFACGSVDQFKFKAPRSGSKVSTAKHMTYESATIESASTVVLNNHPLYRPHEDLRHLQACRQVL
jgi:hypothetical protein